MLTGEDAAHMPTGADAKWRFFWRCVLVVPEISKSDEVVSLGEQPAHTEFPELNAPPVVPRAFPNWAKVMDECVYFVCDVVCPSSRVVLQLGRPHAPGRVHRR